MFALAAAFLLQSANLPEKAVVDFSGIPAVTGGNITIQSHSVTLLIAKDHVDVSSLTLVKNNGAAGTEQISIPELGNADAWGAKSNLVASWAGKPLTLSRAESVTHTSHGDHEIGFPMMEGKGPMVNLGTYALRVSYTVPIGKCGFDHKQFLAAYDLASAAPIGTLMVTYSYARGVVFHEPEAGPDLGWQIGLKGAFVKVQNYAGKGGLSYCAFYSGGFKSIG